MGYSGDDVFCGSITSDKTTPLLQQFIDTLNRKEDFEYLTNLEDSKIKAIFFFNNNYICIQKDRIIKHINKYKKFKLTLSSNKFNVLDNIITISIKNYYDAVIKINYSNNNEEIENYSIYFNSPQDVILHNILSIPGHNPYKYNDEESLKQAIRTTPYLTKLINVGTLDNIAFDNNTKKKLNRLVDLKEEDFKKVINELEVKYSNKNYVVPIQIENSTYKQLSFPRDIKEFNELLKIVFTKIYTWETSAST